MRKRAYEMTNKGYAMKDNERDFALTGYRDHTDKNGKNNREAAVEFLTNLQYIPRDEDGKFNVYLLNELPVPEGSASPLEMFRRGLLELGTASFLDNEYPEWLGDATDDADQDLQTLMYMHDLKEGGYDKMNEHLNNPPTESELEEFPHENLTANILYWDQSAIANELHTLMTGRAETKRLKEERKAESIRKCTEKHNRIVAWAKATHGLDIHPHEGDSQGIFTTFYVADDGLTGYIIWDVDKIVLTKERTSTDVDWWASEGITVTHYMFTSAGIHLDVSTYPHPA